MGEHDWDCKVFYCRDGSTLRKRSSFLQTIVTVLVLTLSSEESPREGDRQQNTGKYQLVCLKILTSCLPLRKESMLCASSRAWLGSMHCLPEGTSPFGFRNISCHSQDYQIL